MAADENLFFLSFDAVTKMGCLIFDSYIVLFSLYYIALLFTSNEDVTKGKFCHKDTHFYTHYG